MKLIDYYKNISEGKNMEINTNKGYVYIPNTIRRCLRITHAEKMAFYELSSLYNETKGCAYPTQQTLAMSLGVSSSAISKILDALEEKNFIGSFRKIHKVYCPSFNLHNNRYVVLSEWFHFATKTINQQKMESIGGNWGDKMLRFVNCTVEQEFTEEDIYGKFLIKLSEPTVSLQGIRTEFFDILIEYISNKLGKSFPIDWNLALSDLKSNKKTEREFNPFKKQNSSGLAIPEQYLQTTNYNKLWLFAFYCETEEIELHS